MEERRGGGGGGWVGYIVWVWDMGVWSHLGKLIKTIIYKNQSLLQQIFIS